jgi:hypothetical protein
MAGTEMLGMGRDPPAGESVITRSTAARSRYLGSRAGENGPFLEHLPRHLVPAVSKIMPRAVNRE